MYGKNAKEPFRWESFLQDRPFTGEEKLCLSEFAFVIFRGFEPRAFPNPDNLEPPIGGLSNNAGVVVLPTRPLEWNRKAWKLYISQSDSP